MWIIRVSIKTLPKSQNFQTMSYDYVVIIMNNSKLIPVDCCWLEEICNTLTQYTERQRHGCYIATYCLRDVTKNQLKYVHANITDRQHMVEGFIVDLQKQRFIRHPFTFECTEINFHRKRFLHRKTHCRWTKSWKNIKWTRASMHFWVKLNTTNAV